ncbi:methyltransferase-like protein, putative [Plasmodium ovale]|uniref:Methyltransferase-like protein, putative n=2 Tax=Plasmodium ovale TaxID=36330 RepID=A0A1D3U962_PLAOA|nr:putative N6-DNA-methyltransferase [Plasmodium ovale curtisi]SBS97863.1 putative N6-DNA-methyltransferase [Plasmodium ovale curtisi]SCQ16673.1 methyltransferase-like protein, putative [Plasmodium ovale]
MPASEEFKINFDYLYRNEGVRKNVYLPGSDTFAFIEALKDEVESFTQDINVALEMGSGSGYLILSMYELLLNRNIKIGVLYCVDINKDACSCVRNIASENKIANVEIINADLFNNIRKCGQFDLIIFNPPYVATEQGEMNRTDIVASYAGGEHGREVILKFLLSVYDYVSDNGVIYILLEKNNMPHETMNSEQITNKFHCTQIKEKQTLNETIFIYKLSKKLQ